MANLYSAANTLIQREHKCLMVREGKKHVKDTYSIPRGGVEPIKTLLKQ